MFEVFGEDFLWSLINIFDMNNVQADDVAEVGAS